MALPDHGSNLLGIDPQRDRFHLASELHEWGLMYGRRLASSGKGTHCVAGIAQGASRLDDKTIHFPPALTEARQRFKSCETRDSPGHASNTESTGLGPRYF